MLGSSFAKGCAKLEPLVVSKKLKTRNFSQGQLNPLHPSLV